MAAAAILLAPPAAARAASGSGAAAAAAAPVAAEAAPPLELAELLREAAARSPEIAAARGRLRAAEAVPSQMEALPDPVAGVTYQNESFTTITYGDTEDSFLAFSWTQELPYPGKLDRAGDVARGEAAMSRTRLDRIGLEVAARIKSSYADLYRIDRTAAILSGSRELLVSFRDTARARYETGEGLLENVLKAQTEITNLDARIETLAQERASAAAMLNAAVGRAGDPPLGPAASLPEPAPAPDRETLVREAVERSPEVREMEAALVRDEARLDLARRQLKPDLMWGAMYANRGDLDPMIAGSFGLRLPVFRGRKQVQGIVQARHEAEAARLDLETVRLRVAAEVRGLAARAARAGTLVRLYAEGILPQARAALESASAAYGVGRVDFLTLLTDFTTLLTYEIEHETQRSERVAALAEIERLTGRVLVPAGPEPGTAPGPPLEGESHE
jgi:outer membrane protein TolC